MLEVLSAWREGLLAQHWGFLSLMWLGGILALGLVAARMMRQRRRVWREMVGRDTRFLQAFHDMRAPLDLANQDHLHGQSVHYRIYQAGCEELGHHLIRSPRPGAGWHTRLSAHRLPAILIAMRRATSAEINKLEEGISTLSALVQLMPWMGLFGAVTEIVFCNLRGHTDDNASSAAVALVYVMAGMAASVPLWLTLHFHLAKFHVFCRSLATFRDDFLTYIEREMVDYSLAARENEEAGSTAAPSNHAREGAISVLAHLEPHHPSLTIPAAAFQTPEEAMERPAARTNGKVIASHGPRTNQTVRKIEEDPQLMAAEPAFWSVK